jgi:aspartyl-tRNA(Asn)/glutamyl-tRNA(Gln) amidotransferase subunit A
MTLSWTLDKVGPLARSADDCATVLGTIAGSRFEALSAADIDERLPHLRIAWLESEIDEADASLRASLGAAVETVAGLGPKMVPIGLRRDIPLIEPLELIVKVEGSFERRDLLRDPGFRMSDARQLATLRSGLETPAADYLEATRVAIPAAIRAFSKVFAEADIILSASRVIVAPSLSEERPPRDATKMSDLLRAAGNLAGVPGISFPCGLSDEGLPVGLQAIGPRGSDALLLGIAAAFQRATTHHRLRPPVVIP